MSRISYENDKDAYGGTGVPEHTERRGSHIVKGPGHIDVHEVKDAELDAAEDTILAESEFTPEEYKKLRRKIDMVIMPVLMIMYGLQYSDKVSLSQGVLFNLREDTKLVKNQYADLTTFFYIGYLAAQLPMGYLMQRFPLGKALSTFVIIWGGMVMLLGACNNYWQLSIVRVLLGWFESVVTPGFAMITASWYLRREQTLRQGLYFSMNTTFAIIFGIANYELARRQQASGGLAAWRVINLFLGGLTIAMGIVCMFTLGTPSEVWWLSKREKRMAHARIVSNATGGGEQHPWRWAQVRECLRDPAYWMALLANVLSTIPNGAVTTFNTLLLRSFGYNALESILYQFPGNAVNTGVIIITSIIVYKWPKMRFPVSLFFQFVSIFSFLFVGLGGKGGIGNKARYIVFTWVAVFVVPLFMIWPLMSSNIAGRTKKTFNAACMLVGYCVGNIIGSQIMLPKDAPHYITGLTAIAICMSVNVVNLCALWWYYHHTNKKREAAFVASGLAMEQREHENRVAGETDLTDMENPHFRYLC